MDSGVVVSNDQQRSGTSESRVFSYGHVPLRELEEFSSSSFESMVELFKPLGDNFLGKLIEKDWSSSGTYISNVIIFSDNRERDVLHKYLVEQGQLFRRDLFGFSFDDDHVHIIHSCAFSSSQCKCRWRKEIPCGQLRPGYKYRSNLREWGRRDFLSGVLYFFFRKGGRKEAWIEGRCQRLEDNRKYYSVIIIPIIIALYYLQLKVYNGKKWKENAGSCWDHWKTRLDMTYNDSSPMKNLVDQVIESANAEMDTKKWKKIKKDVFRNGRSYRGKYMTYSRGRRYAH